MSKLISTLAVALVLLGATGAAVELKLQAIESSYRRGEPIVVRALVTNPLASKQVPYLKRDFWLVPYSYPMNGDLGLRIQVTAPDGTVLSPTSTPMIVVRMRTDPSLFQALRPGEGFGREMAHDGQGLEFHMTAPGVYRVAHVVGGVPKEMVGRVAASESPRA